MPLQEYFDPDRIRIQNLSVENPERKNGLELFNPEKFITAEIWDEIKEKIKSDSLLGIFSLMEKIKILFPERINKIFLDRNEIELHTLMGRIDNGIGKSDLDVLNCATQLKIISPETFAGENYKEVIDLMKTKETMNGLDARTYLHYTKKIGILCPDWLLELGVTSSLFEKSFETLKNSPVDESFLESYVDLAANLKILFPEKNHEICSLFDSFLVQKINDYIDKKLQEGDLQSACFALVSMKILAAKEIKITENEFKIIMPGDKHLKDKSAMPESRKF